MDRGLSELQKIILIRACKNRTERGKLGWDTCYPEILDEYWRREHSMAEIGEKHYRAVEASLSRAAQGLVERGLIERSRVYGGAQLDLTEQGEELARTLVEDQTRV